MPEQNTLTLVPERVLDILPNTDKPEPSASSDRPVPRETSEGTPRPENDEAAKLAEDDKAKAQEDAKKAPEEHEDKTPPEEKAYITKAKKRIKAAEDENLTLREQLRMTQEIAQRFMPKESDKPEPKRDAFDDPDQYAEAKAEWLADQKVAVARQEQERKVKAAEDARIFAAHMERMEKAEKKYPGITELHRDNSLPISEAMADAIKLSESGPDVLHYLDENREEARKIYKLPTALAGVEIGKIEAMLTAKPAVTAQRLPKPMNTVGGNGTVIRNKYDPGVSSEDYWKIVDAERAEKVAKLQAKH